MFRDGPPDVRVVDAIRDWAPHGIIAHLFDPALCDALTGLDKPVVNTTSTLEDCPFPLVEVDHLLVGQIAARHLLERGFRNFGFFGSSWTGFSRGREKGFTEELAKHGHAVTAEHADFLPRLSVQASWRELDKRILDWLHHMPKPAAILASNDLPAKELVRACRHLGLEVPSEVAVLGVDNDEIECHLARPPLSSIELPTQRIGYEAARMLDLLMHGRKLVQSRRLIPPVRIVPRQSTDTLAVEDAVVAKVVGHIRRHAVEGINVADVVREIPTSRRSLERRFKQIIGHSVLDEIRRTRVEHAKELLATTNLPMPIIAERTGFSTPARFCHVFRQFSGQSPREFRKGVSVAG